MNKNKEALPLFDLPQDWLVGTDVSRELLGMYANYPVRLKCEIISFCMGGEVEASVNLNRFWIHPYECAVITPETIFQVHQVKGDVKLYFLGFSSSFYASQSQLYEDSSSLTPLLTMTPENADVLESFMKYWIKFYNAFDESVRKRFSKNIFEGIHIGLRIMSSKRTDVKISLNKNDQLYRDFSNLVTAHYKETRNVAWYASRLGITQAHLCNVIRQASGKTCTDIIATLVIMDAKSQLKSTRLSIQAISDSLSFADISFFGKYFKRHTGMSPLEFRNS